MQGDFLQETYEGGLKGVVRRRVEEAVTPKCFEGLPITLVAAAVTSLSFMGFGGIVESIFGA